MAETFAMTATRARATSSGKRSLQAGIRPWWISHANAGESATPLHRQTARSARRIAEGGTEAPRPSAFALP